MNLNIPRPSRDYLKYNIISGLLDPGRVQEDAALAGNGRRRQVLAELAADDAVVAVRLADLAPDRTELAAVDLPLGLVNVGHPVTEKHGGSASARSHMGAEQTAARQPRQEFRGHTPTNRDPDIVPKLKTLRSRLPRRRQEAAFVAFAFEPRGRGSSTQGVLQLKNLPLGPSAAAAFSCRSGITLHAEAPPSCRPDDETTTGHDTH